MAEKDRALSELYARLDDMRERAGTGEVAVSRYLTEAEAKHAELYLKKFGSKIFFCGGYEGAERKRAYILPEYMELDGQTDLPVFLAEYGFSTQISALLIKGSGYEKLSHRDFLGALLGLGIERSVLGDIAVLHEEKSAVVFCDAQIAPFILSELSSVARDKVKTERIEIQEGFLPERKFVDINEPISSMRLDCIVSALCSLSREKASSLIIGSFVDVEFETEQKPDRRIELPCIISVRGFGKYRLLRADVKTKKGRYRLEAQKYL